MRKTINAMFPGTFDPIHEGHLDVIKRASKLFNKLYVVVSINIYKTKASILDNRLKDVEKAIKKLNLKNVIVTSNKGLTVEFAKKNNISVIVRSIRNAKDAKYEIDMAQVNNALDNKIETILMLPRHKLINLSSTAIRYLNQARKNK